MRDHARGRYRGQITSFGPKRILPESDEETLVSYIVYMSDRGFPATRKVVKNLAREMIREKNPSYAGPSRKWLRNFLKRHKNLSIRKAHALDKGRASLTQGQIDQYFSLLKETLVRLDIGDKQDRICNVDETRFSGNLSPNQDVVVKKGVRQAFRAQISLNGHVTVNYAINATGETVPTFLIFSKNLPRSSYINGLPESWYFETTKSGFMMCSLVFLRLKPSLI